MIKGQKALYNHCKWTKLMFASLEIVLWLMIAALVLKFIVYELRKRFSRVFS